MNSKLERRAIAFIRTIANRCTSCLHRTPEHCRGCVSQWANEIMSDYERGASCVKPAEDYSLAARKLKILDILQQAGRPLLSSEIDISAVCSKTLKEWTLRRMLESRQICRAPHSNPHDRRHLYLYSIPQTPTPNRSKPNGNPSRSNRESQPRSETRRG